jgi:lactate 2-monooxygenase
MPSFGLEVQTAVYGRPPGTPDDGLPFAIEEWERLARSALPPGPFGYVACGAGGEETVRANRVAFERQRIWPRMARDVADRELAVTVLGTPSPAPFLLAPIGVQGILHPEGERAVARAAAATRIPFALSTVSSVTIEEIASIMGDAPRWFQLYPSRDPAVTASLVRRAESAGYRAIVVTLDTTMLGWRETDLAHAFLPFLAGQGIANFLSDPAFLGRLSTSPRDDPRAAIVEFLRVYVNPSFSWSDVDTLRRRTTLPLILKGIVHPDDAKLAIAHGADGIIVSNHGGRQVDGAVAALDALPLVVDAVGGRVPVLMDSGIRRGADVLKAMALGAAAVLLGRPYAYALAAAGQAGVERVIRNLHADIDLELALAGQRSVRDLDRSLLSP